MKTLILAPEVRIPITDSVDIENYMKTLKLIKAKGIYDDSVLFEGFKRTATTYLVDAELCQGEDRPIVIRLVTYQDYQDFVTFIRMLNMEKYLYLDEMYVVDCSAKLSDLYEQARSALIKKFQELDVY